MHKVGKDSTFTNHGWNNFGDNWWINVCCKKWTSAFYGRGSNKSNVSMEGVILDATNGSPLNTMKASMHVATNEPNLNTIHKQL